MRAGALSLLLASALILLSAAGVSADANPNNRGHHYGQLKHQHVPPPPPPPPAPAPPPPTTTPPAITPPPPGTPPPAGGAQTAASSGAGTAADSLNTTAGNSASQAAPPTEIKPVLPNPVEVKVLPNGDPLWWLLLVLALSLAGLWCFVAARLAQTALKRRAAQVS